MNLNIIDPKTLFNVVITETTDTLTNTINKQMFVSKTIDNKIIYKVRGNFSIILESLFKNYGYDKLNINELNEKDSLLYLAEINNTMKN